MREIKFRVWHDNQGMIYPDNKFIIVTGTHILKLDPAIKESRYFIMPLSDFDIMQFTGFKDNDGIDIYEDDILEWTLIYKAEFVGREDTVSKTKYKVVHEMNNIMGIAGFYFKDEKGKYCHFHNFNGVKIIGNVHEHPDMITKYINLKPN